MAKPPLVWIRFQTVLRSRRWKMGEGLLMPVKAHVPAFPRPSRRCALKAGSTPTPDQPPQPPDSRAVATLFFGCVSTLCDCKVTFMNS